MHKLLIAAIFGIYSTLSTAQDTPFGRPGDPKKVSRTLDVEMIDKPAFSPPALTLKRGETVLFRIKNAGQVDHELVLGTKEQFEKQAAAVRRHVRAQRDVPYMAHIAPGKNGAVVWEFTNAGEVYYACLIPGHLEAGMVGRIQVVSEKAAGRK